MKKIIYVLSGVSIAFLAIIIIVLATSGSDAKPTADCSVLQQQFNDAMEVAESLPSGHQQQTARLSEAKTIDQQMREQGCY